MLKQNMYSFFRQASSITFNFARKFHSAWPALETEIKNGRQSLDILFLVTSHNTMSQKVYSLLSSSYQHRVMVELYSNDKVTERVRALKPHLIICPFLTQPIPSQIYNEFITLIIHPGPIGDRGPHSVDRWVLERPKEWGITILQAVEKLDAGPVWIEEKIDTELHLSPTATKSDAYNLLTSVTMKAMKRLLDQILSGFNPSVEQPGK
jgi:putative two-component system hydrogenase maturation factor HypX/HoxX